MLEPNRDSGIEQRPWVCSRCFRDPFFGPMPSQAYAIRAGTAIILARLRAAAAGRVEIALACSGVLWQSLEGFGRAGDPDTLGPKGGCATILSVGFSQRRPVQVDLAITWRRAERPECYLPIRQLLSLACYEPSFHSNDA